MHTQLDQPRKSVTKLKIQISDPKNFLADQTMRNIVQKNHFAVHLTLLSQGGLQCRAIVGLLQDEDYNKGSCVLQIPKN